MGKTDFNSYDREFLQNLINVSTSISEVLKKLDLAPKGANHVKFSKFIKENNYDTTTLVGRALNKGTIKGQFKQKELSKCLVKNGSGNSNKLRQRLINAGVKKNECECCHIQDWNGQPITFQLHHINGDHFDNRLENLIILCPNCHSQTTNWCSKRRGDKMDGEDFYERLKQIAERNSDAKYQKLLEREEKRREEIYQNHLCNGEISKGIWVSNPKKIRYCEYCGKEITGKGKRFCSVECTNEFARDKKYDKDILLEQSKTVHSLIELGKLYNVTDNAIRKHLRRLGIIDNVKENFLSYCKGVEQYDIEGNFIREWKNSREAADSLNISKSKINAACSGRQKTTGGYIWKYKN